MRDPKRIKPLLKKLRKLWLQHPDLRLGQLVSSAVTFANEDAGRGGRGGGVSVFYCEDDLLERGLDIWLEELEK